MIIYKVTNKINGKMYVGQTTKNLELRKNQHINEATIQRDNYYFHNALRKYDIKDFKWEIIEYCDSKEEMDEMEFHYIKRYNSFGKDGYNLTYGGEGIVGLKHSKETKQKISDANKGRKRTMEVKRKFSEVRKGKFAGKDSPWFGKHLSEKTKRKISDALKSKFVGKNHPFYGKHHTEETKKKMSKAFKGKNNPFFGKHHTEEVKKKLSDVFKGQEAPNLKAVLINNKYFNSRKQAAEFIGVAPSTIRCRILHKTKWLDYRYVHEGEN